MNRIDIAVKLAPKLKDTIERPRDAVLLVFRLMDLKTRGLIHGHKPIVPVQNAKFH
jgi:hypothetical protein